MAAGIEIQEDRPHGGLFACDDFLVFGLGIFKGGDNGHLPAVGRPQPELADGEIEQSPLIVAPGVIT